MLGKALQLLKGKSEATAADLRAALAGLDVEAAEALARELEAERRRVLLDGDDKQLLEIEAKIASAYRDVERTAAAIEELKQRIARADAAEAHAVLSAERNAVEAQAKAVAAELRRDYPKVAGRLVEMLEKLQAAEARVAEVNARLGEAGRADEALEPVEPRAIPMPVGQASSVHSILNRTKLRTFGNQFAAGWGDPFGRLWE